MSPSGGKRQYIPQHTYRGRVQREARFDNVRGFLIMLVVIGHFLMPLYQTRLITGIFYAIYIFHMPCFMIVSGYYAKTVYRDGRFRWGKVVQMLWLYFLFKNVVNVTEGLLNGHIPVFPNFFRESGAPWYLLVMAYYYLTVPLLCRVNNRQSKFIAVTALFVFISFAKYFIHTGSWFCMDRALSFFPFFAAGYFISQNTVDRYMLWKGKRGLEILAAVLVLTVFLFTYDFLLRWNLVVYGTDYNRYLETQHSYLWLLNIAWYLIAFVISTAFIGIMLNRRMLVVTELGKNTLQVYFLHRPIRDLLQYFGFFALINPHSKLNVLFFIVLCMGLAVLLGSPVISYFFKRVRTVFDPLLEKRGAL